MIEFNFETDFSLTDETRYKLWVQQIIASENKTYGDLCFVFCDDTYLHKLNLEHLQHDDFTDILTFDYCVGDEINGDIFISVERLRENALDFSVTFENELLRVLSHGVLHLCGYKDKSDSEIQMMRLKEEEKLILF